MFRALYAHRQELTTKMLITTLVVSFLKDGRGGVNAKLWFLVVYFHTETYTTKNHNFTLTPPLPSLRKETTNVVIKILVVSS